MILNIDFLKIHINSILFYTESELVALIKNNSKSGYDYLYANYSCTLYGIVKKIISNDSDANDVLQEVFVKIWSGIATYNPDKARLYTWMYNIARNASIDFIRHSAHIRKSQTIDFDRVELMNEPKWNYSIETIGIKNFANTLDPKYYVLIDLAYFKGYTMGEISKQTDMPLGTVKTRLRKAMQILRHELSQENKSV